MNKRLWITLSIALLGASANSAVAPSQIEKIEILIEDGNWVELRAYLSRNPSLLRGNDALSEELRQFMSDTENLFTALVFEDSLFPDMTALPDPVPTRRAQPSRVTTPTRSASNATVQPRPTPAPASETPVIKQSTTTVIDMRGSSDRSDDDDDRVAAANTGNTGSTDDGDPLGPRVNLAAPTIY